MASKLVKQPSRFKLKALNLKFKISGVLKRKTANDPMLFAKTESSLFMSPEKILPKGPISRFDTVAEACELELQKRKKEEEAKKLFRIATKHRMNGFRYILAKDNNLTKQWNYVTAELPKKMPKGLVTSEQKTTWLFAHFTKLSLDCSDPAILNPFAQATEKLAKQRVAIAKKIKKNKKKKAQKKKKAAAAAATDVAAAAPKPAAAAAAPAPAAAAPAPAAKPASAPAPAPAPATKAAPAPAPAPTPAAEAKAKAAAAAAAPVPVPSPREAKKQAIDMEGDGYDDDGPEDGTEDPVGDISEEATRRALVEANVLQVVETKEFADLCGAIFQKLDFDGDKKLDLEQARFGFMQVFLAFLQDSDPAEIEFQVTQFMHEFKTTDSNYYTFDEYTKALRALFLELGTMFLDAADPQQDLQDLPPLVDADDTSLDYDQKKFEQLKGEYQKQPAASSPRPSSSPTTPRGTAPAEAKSAPPTASPAKVEQKVDQKEKKPDKTEERPRAKSIWEQKRDECHLAKPEVVARVTQMIQNPNFLRLCAEIFNAFKPKEGQIALEDARAGFVQVFTGFYPEEEHRPQIEKEVNDIINATPLVKPGKFEFREFYECLKAIFYGLGCRFFS